MMQYASPGQINFIVPQNMGPGAANVVVEQRCAGRIGDDDDRAGRPGDLLDERLRDGDRRDASRDHVAAGTVQHDNRRADHACCDLRHGAWTCR